MYVCCREKFYANHFWEVRVKELREFRSRCDTSQVKRNERYRTDKISQKLVSPGLALSMQTIPNPSLSKSQISGVSIARSLLQGPLKRTCISCACIYKLK